jgi:hypothetical protein
MRVLRRIAGDPRFSTKMAMTDVAIAKDVEVRIKLQMPSLDCLRTVARLGYLAPLRLAARRGARGRVQPIWA